MNNKKTMLLTGDTYFESIYSCTKSSEVEFIFAFKGSKSRILSALRILWQRYKLPFKKLWYRKLKFEDYEKVIVFDAFMDAEYLSWLREYSEMKIPLFFYYWNVWNPKKIAPKDVEKLGYDVWSYDKGDCEKYGMSYNPQFYADSWYKDVRVAYDVDVSFVGRDKGTRTKEVEIIKETLKQQGVEMELYITAPKWYKRFKSNKYKKYLNFKRAIMQECKGRAVLDVSPTVCNGYTLRVYDALVNKRKLITNNKDLLWSDFYSSNNIFILGRDDISNIREFLNSKMDLNKLGVIKEFKIEKWAERFYIKKNEK